MGRSHDFYCVLERCYWSPFDSDHCPSHGPGECSFYDLNYEAEELIPGREDGKSEADLHREKLCAAS